MDKKIAVDIFGSCVTRDALVYASDFLDPGVYVARSSFVSSVDDPIDIPIPTYEVNARCDFDRKCVLRDLGKTAFSELGQSTSHSKYLVIDFIDERFALGRTNAGQFFTKSNELLYSGLLSDSETYDFGTSRLDKSHTLPKSMVDEMFHLWSTKLLKLYPMDNIVIHAAHFVDYYLDRNAGTVEKFDPETISRNHLWNEKLDMIHSLAKRYIPNPGAFLDYTPEYCADTNHRWGLSSCHYQPEYYRRVADDIKRAYFGENPPIHRSEPPGGLRQLFKFKKLSGIPKIQRNAFE